MNEQSELNARIEALEKRVKYLEDTFATLADMNKSGEMGQYIAQRQRALAASKLVNAAAGSQKLNADAQQQVIDQLAAEKAAMDARIEEAIRAAEQNAPAEDDLAEQFAYRDVPGGVEIQGFNGFEVDELVIPAKIKGKAVVKIGEEAFKNMNIKKAVLPDTITYIGKSAFENCKKLGSIVLPRNLVSLEPCCFCDTGLAEITMPEKLKEIGYMCFFGCEKLCKVILNEELVSIGNSAFEMTHISSIIVPESVQTIGISAFGWIEKIAILGTKTKCSFPRHAIVYCLSGSEAQKQARLEGVTVKPLSEFRNV